MNKKEVCFIPRARKFGRILGGSVKLRSSSNPLLCVTLVQGVVETISRLKVKFCADEDGGVTYVEWGPESFPEHIPMGNSWAVCSGNYGNCISSP